MSEAKTMTIKTSWDEVTLGEYLKISAVEVDNKLAELGTKKTIKFVAILSNKSEAEINDMSYEMFVTLCDKVSFLHLEEPKRSTGKPFKIKGKDYIFVRDFSKLTTGEMVSIEQAIKDSSKSKKAFLSEILAILIRPCTSVKDEETGKTENVIEKFTTKNLKYRERLFIKELKVPDFLSRIEAFMTGANRSKMITSLSSVRATKLKELTERLSKELRKKSL